MTAEQFTYWLQGFVELGSGPPTEEQWAMIREHLQLVFNKITTKHTGFYKGVPINPDIVSNYQEPPILDCGDSGLTSDNTHLVETFGGFRIPSSKKYFGGSENGENYLSVEHMGICCSG